MIERQVRYNRANQDIWTNKTNNILFSFIPAKILIRKWNYREQVCRPNSKWKKILQFELFPENIFTFLSEYIYDLIIC